MLAGLRPARLVFLIGTLTLSTAGPSYLYRTLASVLEAKPIISTLEDWRKRGWVAPNNGCVACRRRSVLLYSG